MDEYETRKPIINSNKLSSKICDIDQLCSLINENTFGFKSITLTKFHSIPSYQIKIFHSTRLKRLNSSLKIIKSNINENDNSSLLNKFRLLSTYNLSQSRNYPSSTINEEEEEEINSLSTAQSQLSSNIVDKCMTTSNSCNVEELAAYLDNYLYLPKSLSGAAELMYT